MLHLFAVDRKQHHVKWRCAAFPHKSPWLCRTWTIVWGLVSLLTVLLPSFQNYRAFSFFGLVATTFTAWYMMGTAVHERQQPGVTHSGPLDPQQFFTGATNILFTFGGHAMAVYVSCSCIPACTACLKSKQMPDPCHVISYPFYTHIVFLYEVLTMMCKRQHQHHVQDCLVRTVAVRLSVTGMSSAYCDYSHLMFTCMSVVASSATHKSISAVTLQLPHQHGYDVPAASLSEETTS